MSCEGSESDDPLHGTDRQGDENFEYDDVLKNTVQGQARLNEVPDVYENAAAIGRAMEPILEEFGHDKLEPLTQEVVGCLENFEKCIKQLTAEIERSLEYQYSLERLKHESDTQKKKFERELARNDETILQLHATIDSLQNSHDSLVENWEMTNDQQDDPAHNTGPSKTELSLAKQLREALDKCNRLDREVLQKQDDIEILAEKLQKFTSLETELNRTDNSITKTSEEGENPDTFDTSLAVEKNLVSRTTSTMSSLNKSKDSQGEKGEIVSLAEFQKVLREKNYYKEKCFAMEDQLTEYKMSFANQQIEIDSRAVESLSSFNLSSTNNNTSTPTTYRQTNPQSNNRFASSDTTSSATSQFATSATNTASQLLSLISPTKPNLRRLFSLASKQEDALQPGIDKHTPP